MDPFGFGKDEGASARREEGGCSGLSVCVGPPPWHPPEPHTHEGQFSALGRQRRSRAAAALSPWRPWGGLAHQRSGLGPQTPATCSYFSPSLPPAFVTPADPLQSPPGDAPSGALGSHRSARSLGYSRRTWGQSQRGRGPCLPHPKPQVEVAGESPPGGQCADRCVQGEGRGRG